MKPILQTLVLIILMSELVACATPLRLKVNAATALNPDENGRSLPVHLVVYQLRDNQVFKQATFQELWQNDKATLDSSLLARREFSIAPAHHMTLDMSREKQAMYLGVIAIFRMPENGHWRGIVKLGKGVPMMHKSYYVELKGNRLHLQG